MASIEVRISALAAEVRRRQFANEGPVDALSQSLFELEGDLLGLDDLGKTAFLAELNQEDEDGAEGVGIEPETLERWIADIRENKKLIW